MTRDTGSQKFALCNSRSTVLTCALESKCLTVVPEGFLAEDLLHRPTALRVLVLLLAHRHISSRNAPLLLAALQHLMKGVLSRFPALSEEERLSIASTHRRNAKRTFRRFAGWMNSRFPEEGTQKRTLARADGGILVAGDALDDYVQPRVGVHGGPSGEGRLALLRLLNSFQVRPDDSNLFVPAVRPGPVVGAQNVSATTAERFRRIARRLDSRMEDLDRSQLDLDQHAFKLWRSDRRNGGENRPSPLD